MAISLGSIYGDIRLALSPLRADGDAALSIFGQIQESLAKLEELAGQTGARMSEAFGTVAPSAEEATTATTDAGAAMTEMGTKAETAGTEATGAMEKAGTAAQEAGEKAKESGFSFGELGKHVLEFTGTMIGMNLVFNVWDKLAEGIHSVFEQIGDTQAAETELNTVLQSTHDKVGLTAAQLEDYATKLSETTQYSKDVVMHTQSLLLTFTNIGKDAMPQATTAALNLSQMMGGDTKQAAILLGKALNDPIKGVTALTRVGVSLSDQQKKAIKDYMAVGDAADAQKVILGELNTEFGNQATAYGKTLPGQLAILKNSLANAGEAVEQKLLPKLQDLVANVGPKLVSLFQRIPDAVDAIGDVVGPVFDQIGGIVKDIAPSVSDLVHTFADAGAKAGNPLNTIKFALLQVQPIVKDVGGVFKDTLVPALKSLAPVVSGLVGNNLAQFHGILAQIHPILKQVGTTLHNVMLPIFETLANVVATDVLPTVKNLQQVFISQVLPALLKLWTAIEPLAELLAHILGPVLQIVGWILSHIVGPALLLLINGLAFLITVIATVIGWITNIGDTLGWLGKHFGDLFGVIGSFVGNVLGAIGGLIGRLLGWFGDLPGKIGSAIGDLLGKIGAFKDQALAKIGAFKDQFIAKIGELITQTVTFWTGLPGRLLGALGNLIGTVMGKVGELRDKVHDKIWEIIDNTITTFQTLPGKLLGIGGDMITGLLNGLKNNAGQVLDWIKGLAGNILSGVKGIFGIASPSKEFAKIGTALGDGMVQGLTGANVQGRITDHLGTLTPAVAATVGNLSSGTLDPLAAAAGRTSGPGLGSFTVQGDLNITVEIGADEIGDGDPEEIGAAVATKVGPAMATILKQYGYS